MNSTISFIALILSFTLIDGCAKNETVSEPTPLVENFDISMGAYSLNHYFVDTSYLPLYEPYYQNDPPFVNSSTRIVEAEVWVQRLGTHFDTSDRDAYAWINLPPRPATGYDASYRSAAESPGTIERGRFYRLDPSLYRLEGDGYLGVVSFESPDPNDFGVLAIAYSRADGKQYGDFLREDIASSTSPVMVLKMVKPKNLFTTGRPYNVAWRMLLKNIYSIRPSHISKHDFQLQMFRVNDSRILGQPLLNVLGLDRYSIDGTPQPEGDGVFDFLPGRTIQQYAGEIILPSLRPFDYGIRQYFIHRGLPSPDSTYLFPELYDTTQAVAKISSKNKYVARGRAIFG